MVSNVEGRLGRLERARGGDCAAALARMAARHFLALARLSDDEHPADAVAILAGDTPWLAEDDTRRVREAGLALPYLSHEEALAQLAGSAP